jgi:Zn2+/Cd2+-exporting ATPase
MLSEEGELPLAIAAGATLTLGVPLWFWTPEPGATAGRALVWISLAIGGIQGLRAAWDALKEFKPDIDLLMVVGAGLAAAIGHPEEGALLLFLFALAGALEHRALAKARDAVSRLHKLMPASAMIRRGKDWQPIDPDQLAAGDEVLIRPGETIPADAVVIDGRSSIDQSSLTGESLPRPVNIGDAVFAGTINHDGAIEARVTRPVAESSIRRILKMVLEAQERRLPVQKTIDRFSTPYAASVFALAAIVFIFLAFFREGVGLSGAAYKAITLLVVASPCALVLATPTATLCGLSRAARAGVLIKGGDALERLASVRQVALDKTGTLTTGRIEVTHIQPVAGSDVNNLMSLALAAESRSTHPIAAAITRLAESYELQPADLVSFTN